MSADMPKMPEPVAWLVCGGRTFVNRGFTSEEGAKESAAKRNDGARVEPLYTADMMREYALAARSLPPTDARLWKCHNCGAVSGTLSEAVTHDNAYIHKSYQTDAPSLRELQDAKRWNACLRMPKSWWLAAIDEAGLKGGRSLNQAIDAALARHEGESKNG